MQNMKNFEGGDWGSAAKPLPRKPCVAQLRLKVSKDVGGVV